MRTMYYHRVYVDYGQQFQQQSNDQPDKVANPAHGLLKRGIIFPVPVFAPENLVSREMGSAVPSRVVSPLIVHTHSG